MAYIALFLTEQGASSFCGCFAYTFSHEISPDTFDPILPHFKNLEQLTNQSRSEDPPEIL